MLKWIITSALIFSILGIYFAHANYTPLNKQINVKTMQAGKIDYIISTRSQCVGTCKNYSSDYGSSSYGGK